MDECTDAERYPTLSAAGSKMLAFLREHPHAPMFRNQSGNRLFADEVSALREFEQEVLSSRVGWPVGAQPEWVRGHIDQVYADVPYYRELGSAPQSLHDVPVISRAELAQDIARFVPDSVAIDRLINFRTTGTTGHPLLIASHPVVAGRYLSFHKRALRRFGIQLQYGAGQVGVVLLGYQKKCFTYVSVTPTMNESGLAKINLHPDDWRDADDRAKYLDALAPEVYAGDPISFSVLAELPIVARPRALISVSMALTSGLRRKLEERFQCPVLDVYSMNEAGPIAVFDAQRDGHVLLQPRMFIEILDPLGNPMPNGERGEITLTGGFNFCLPLLRYRTGDFASLEYGVDEPVLMNLSGRQPVRFRVENGEWINNINVTHALSHLPLAQFGLHQKADANLVLRLAPNSMSMSAQVLQALAPLFGTARIDVEELTVEGKVLQYTSDLDQSVPS
jgi:phenylacetate-CoA ligase